MDVVMRGEKKETITLRDIQVVDTLIEHMSSRQNEFILFGGSFGCV